MKKIVSIIAICVIATPALAASSGTHARRTMASQMIAAPRQTASVNQLNAAAMQANGNLAAATSSQASKRIEPDEIPAAKPSEPSKPEVDMREKEKAACINNNIGVGNTFVWASRYSNTGNYASMVEDLENPENNTCFVRVDMKSNDGRVSVSDIPAKYFEWGANITCGSWADEAKIKQRILDAKKSGRTWGTVAGVVGGAGLGVGIMELFGNRIIGGKVMGQKALKDDALLRSQLLALKKESPSEYKDFVNQVKVLKRECENKEIWGSVAEADLPDGCKFDFDAVLSIDSSNNG